MKGGLQVKGLLQAKGIIEWTKKTWVLRSRSLLRVRRLKRNANKFRKLQFRRQFFRKFCNKILTSKMLFRQMLNKMEMRINRTRQGNNNKLKIKI